MRTGRRQFLAGMTAVGATTQLGARGRESPAPVPTGFGARNHPLDGVGRESLRIRDVRVRLFSVEIPLEKWWYGCGVTILTEVFTDQGLVGIGGPSPYGDPEFVKEYTETHVTPRVVGQNPFDVDAFAPGHSSFREATAWAGVNVACWDLIGKAKGLSVHELLATDVPPRRSVEHYASAGTLHDWRKRPEDLYDEARRYKDEGFGSMKFRLGEHFEEEMTIDRYIPFLEGLRATVGDDFGLMHENNMRLTLEQCLELAPALKALGFVWLEEPVDRWGRPRGVEGQPQDVPKAIEWYRRIREAVAPVRVSGGETMTTRFEFQDWIDGGGYDIVQPDCDTTGLSEGWAIARHADRAGLPCVPHNWHGGLTWMSNIQLAAAIPNALVLESCRHHNPFREGLFKEPIVVKKGVAAVPTGPGLGVEIVDDADARFPYDPLNHWLKRRPT
jgi:L-alanine-DL-glutamate epimerase-like enolase superfamily enzyme